MNTKKILKGVVGEKQSLTGLAKDNDKDGYVNSIDCKPNNPNKQGWVHDLAEKAKEKYRNYSEERKESREKEREFKEKAKVEAKETYYKEREKYLTEQARKSARQKARSPSFSVVGSLNNLSNNLSQSKKVVGKSNFVMPNIMGVGKKTKSKKDIFNFKI